MLKDFPLTRVYQHIEPGPVTLLTTQAAGKKPNVMAMSWHMMLDFEPPYIGCVVSAANHSYGALRRTRQCVIAVPPAELVEVVAGIGNCSGKDTDKFAVFPLTPLPASRVAPPLVGECVINLECEVRDTYMVNRYNTFVLECVKAWENPKLSGARTLHHQGNGRFAVDGEVIKVKSKMK